MMEVNKIYEGTCLDVIRTFPDKSIDCVITSPPYWQLRDYGWDGQWGMEKTFQEYLEHLWSLMDEIFRVLKDTGTVWVNLGDTYNGNSNGNNNGTCGDVKQKVGVNEQEITKLKGKEPNKCLLLIPHRFAIGCIDRKWIMRNDIIWGKGNAMPEPTNDRFSKKHEYIFFMTKKENYYFDLDSIRDRNKTQEGRLHGVVRNRLYEYDSKINKMNNIKGNMDANGQTRTTAGLSLKSAEEKINPLGKNPGDVSDFWDINTKPSKDAHFASYNTKLIDKPIMAGCPKDGIILDPFCGTATTGCRAIDLQRKFIGIEGKSEYVKIGNKKLLPFQITQQLF